MRKALSIICITLLLFLSACSSPNDEKSNNSASESANRGDTATSESEESSPRSKLEEPKDSTEPMPDPDIDGKTTDDHNSQAQAGLLTAGRWNDLKDWNRWQDLMNEGAWAEKADVWHVYTNERITVNVVYDGKAVTDANVKLKSSNGDVVWETRTNNNGDAELFVQVFTNHNQNDQDEQGNYTVQVEDEQDHRIVENVEIPRKKPLSIELHNKHEASSQVDLMFVVDTTGSMGDELKFLQEELKDVVERVKKDNNQQLQLRVSSNYYRDLSDDYVVRPFNFTANVDDVVRQLENQDAHGGGDYPEAVEKALDNAINDHKWSKEARARLLFLVLDAPPHKDAQVLDELHDAIREAAKQGIRIIPVATSGVNKDTEYVLRAMSIVTGGRYVFLTDHSGVGGEHLEPAVGEYEVEYLNDLLVDLVNEYVK